MCVCFKEINVIDTVEDSYVPSTIFSLLKENRCHKCMNINALFSYFTLLYIFLQLQATDMLFYRVFFFFLAFSRWYYVICILLHFACFIYILCLGITNVNTCRPKLLIF